MANNSVKLKLKMPHTGSIEDNFKLSKHTGPKREHDVRQFCMRARPTAFRFKNKTYVQNMTIGTDFPKLCKINLKTDQVYSITRTDINRHRPSMAIYIEI